MSHAPGILVVDDQAEDLRALAAMLAPLGREVVAAPSGEEALRRLLDEDFAVVVMDVRTPGLDAFETVELIKRRPRHADIAVLFLTAADGDAEQITRRYESGAVDYVLKPVEADVLRSKVAMLLELQRKSAELRASEGRFRAAFEGAPIGMGLSTVEGEWLEVNAALCELLGRPAATLLRDPPRLEPGELRVARSDGSSAHAIVSVSQALDSQGQPLNYVWQLVDVTEQRRAAAEREARAEAEAVADAMGKLQRVTEPALEHLELRELLEQLVVRIREVFDADLARILLVDYEDESRLTVGAASGFESGGVSRAADVELAGMLERGLGHALELAHRVGHGLDLGARLALGGRPALLGHVHELPDVVERLPLA
ncbi:MAG TPA: response regulator, partial [Thermoleophilaceae bacterium]|nr:response regulator [Thermoleophilaceae bacterium]